jgi:hypothetical protein
LIAFYFLERVTTLCSNLPASPAGGFCPDDYVKEYLESHPELPIGAQIKIILRELLTRNIIVQLKEFMSHMGIVSFLKPLIMRRPS